MEDEKIPPHHQTEQEEEASGSLYSTTTTADDTHHIWTSVKFYEILKCNSTAKVALGGGRRGGGVI